MKRTLIPFLPPTLALVGLSISCMLLWNQTAQFRKSVEKIAEDVRISLIDIDGKVVYDTTGQDLPNHSTRAEIEAVKASGHALSIVRESETLHMAMFYHARRVGNYILRIAVPYQSVIDAKTSAAHGLLAAGGIGALIVLALFFFMRQYEMRLNRLAHERDLKDKLIGEMRKLEDFRRDFIANVTHEIRTPATGILGAVEILTENAATLTEQDRHELQNVLKEQSTRLNSLIDDILALAQLEKAESENKMRFAEYNIFDIVQTAVNLAQPQADKAKVKLRLQANAETPFIRPCDPRLVESALSNLIQNALRYSGSPAIDLSVENISGKAVISVADSGIGIPSDCQARLFERFYRVDTDRSRACGGTGLGLAIVKHIAQLHGGDASVTSTPGKGAVFTISI